MPALSGLIIPSIFTVALNGGDAHPYSHPMAAPPRAICGVALLSEPLTHY